MSDSAQALKDAAAKAAGAQAAVGTTSQQEGKAAPAAPAPQALAQLSQADLLQALQSLATSNPDLVRNMLGIPPAPPAAPVAEGPRPEKVYYHRNEGSNVVISRIGEKGEVMPETLVFVLGRIRTTDPVVQDALDGIVDKPGSPVYSKVESRAEGDPLAAAALAQVIAAAERTIDKLGPGEKRPA